MRRLAIGAVLLLAACSAKDTALRWLPDDAATVHCTTAGRDKMPPVLLSSPAAVPPTGLYARRMDPMALNDMGFQRDTVVCAGLIVPSAARVEAAGGEVARLTRLADEGGLAAVRALGRCSCQVAYVRGVRDLLPLCHEATTSRRCETTPDKLETLDAAIAPLTGALAGIDIPHVHWRLAGKTDRPQWFADKLTDLLARHPGGSTVFLPGEPVPPRDGAFVGRLFEVPGIVAVVRQDGGLAWLVARVVGDAMVLDHFAWPAVDADMRGALAAVDAARADALVAELDKPAAHYEPGLDPTKGNLVAIERTGLERMDTLAVALSGLASPPYSTEGEVWRTPTPLVDRLTVRAPFGTDGLALDGRAELSPEGRVWAQALADTPLSPDASELGLSAEPPAFSATRDEPPPFFWRGTAAATSGLLGFSRAGMVLRAIELEHPGSLTGTTHEWKLEVPQGSVGFGGAVAPGPGWEAVADAITERPYTAVVEVSDATVDLQLRPR